MKVNDFKLLATLPEEYDYEIFPQQGGIILVIGKQHQVIIGFLVHENELKPIKNERTRNE
jgi:hypothetical protein